MPQNNLNEYYKEIEVKRLDDGIIVVNLWKDNNREPYNFVRLMFAYDKIIYTGDMCYYIFGDNVHNIFTFYKGEEIQPEYWSEKVHCSDRPVKNEECDIDKLRQLVYKDIGEYFDEIELSEEHSEAVDEIFDYNFDSNSVRAYDALEGLYSVLGIGAYDRVADMIYQSQAYDRRYLFACEVLQWVSNNLDKWLED